MTAQEKALYHQIHPLKLFTDWSTGAASFYLLWHRQMRAALVVTFAPAVITSAVLIRWADLEPQKHSRLGRYIARHMTRQMLAVRCAGNLVMMVGAWYRRTDLLLAGLLVILFGWLRGALLPCAN